MKLNRLFFAVLLLSAPTVFLYAGISANKQTVEKYMNGFNKGDMEMIASCLTDNVVWDLPGAYHLVGKEAFLKEVKNPNFSGLPEIVTKRMVEENNVVTAEGTVRTQRNDGVVINLVFCDVFEMKNGKIQKLTSYLMEVKDVQK